MREDVTYKRLGEVLTIERGGSPRPIKEYITEDANGLNWIKIGDAQEGSKYITSTHEKIKPEGLKKTRFVHKGDFILSNSMSFGRPYILAIDGCIHDGWLVLHDDNNVFDKSYLYYYLSSPHVYEEFKKLAVGGVVNNLNSDIVRKVEVPVLPLSTQELIVDELDSISSVISAKKKQVLELENLAQAIFLDTFGDPISNPKGWEVKKMSEVVHKDCPISYGIVQPGDDVPNGIPVVRPIDLCDNYVTRQGLKRTLKSTSDAYKRTLLNGDEILLCVRGTTGILGMASTELKGCNVTRGIVPLFFNECTSKHYIYYLLKSSGIQEIIAKKTYGTALKQINIKDLREIELPLPPLSLQQAFAEKVQVIEEQKRLINQSIAEFESLLAQRMEFHFA